MTSSEIKKVLHVLGLRPNKLMGQNFLADEDVTEAIIRTARITKKDHILEIGPGLGALTFPLAERARRVTAVEKDPLLAAYVEKKLAEHAIPNVDLVSGDILKLPDEFFAALSPYTVVASIPYYLTARLIRKLLADVTPPSELFLVVQKEVGERIAAKPPHMNLLATSVQLYGTPEIIFSAGQSAFWPEPNVDSVFLAIRSISKQAFEEAGVSEEAVFSLIRAAYQARRKKLASSIEKAAKTPRVHVENSLKQLGIRADARPEALSPHDWLKLTKSTEVRLQ